MIRLIAADLDGTLLNGEREVSAGTLEGIRKARAHGLQVVLATGRTYAAVKRIYETLELDTPVVTNNGALVYLPPEDRVLAGTPLPAPALEALTAWLDREGLYYQFYTRDTVYTRKLGFLSLEWQEKNRRLPEPQQTRIEVLGDQPLAPLLETETFYKLLVMDEAPEALDRVRAHLAGLEALDWTVSIDNGLDILPRGITKGEGLRMLAEAAGFGPHEIMAFGDQENDIEMLRYAGVGVAMENAVASVKAAADRIAPLHHEDGLVRFLSEYFHWED